MIRDIVTTESNSSSLAQACRLLGLPAVAQVANVELRFLHRRLKPGMRLCSQGEPLEALYVVVAGTFKAFVDDAEGAEVVLAFPARGDLVGADALCDQHHASYVTALDDTEVIVLPAQSLALLGRALDGFNQFIYRALSREVVAGHALRSSIQSLGAEARVARFLAQLSARSGFCGGGNETLTLPMSRQEIGRYLGLTIETVSRAFSALQAAGHIGVSQRTIRIRDLGALETAQPVATSRAAPRPAAARTRRQAGTGWGGLLAAA